MASTPSSIASSSDLYAPSEQVEDQVQSQTARNGTSSLEASVPDGRLLSPASRSSPGAPSVQERTVLSMPATCDPAASAGPPPNGYHKRKREEHSQSYPAKVGQNPLNVSTLVRDPNGSGHESFADPFVSLDSQSGPKRTKTVASQVEQDGLVTNQALPCNLPAELWQNVFRFVPPVFLGRLLRVNRLFNSFLTPGRTNPKALEHNPPTTAKPLEPETIWAASRKRFAPGLPKPIRGLTELDMWRLLRGQNCQICGETKSPVAGSSAENPWESGPGAGLVRVIWPFGVRTCGPCLDKCSEKEIDLLLSSACPSFLLPALPFAFVTDTNDYIPNLILRNSGGQSSVSMTKYYYKPHVRKIKEQLDEVRELGAGSAEEWSKGLAEEGKERINDAIRWEQWEARGGLKKVNIRPLSKTTAASTPTVHSMTISYPRGGNDSDRSTPQGLQVPPIQNGASIASPMEVPYFPQNPLPSYQPSWPMAAPLQDGPMHRQAGPFPPHRPERSIKDVNEAKAARRAEIERRCSLFDPPLPPNLLNHMESFQAAIQIPTALTEPAWDILKPRLLSQREYAEKREQEQIQQNELLQVEYTQRRQQEAQLKETKESFDRHWDSVQTPIRERLGALADEIIEDQWAGGRLITKDTSPKFASDVLIHVRRRFYEDVTHENEILSSAGQPIQSDPPNGPPTRKLILENMKWLFDTKIKPLTEHFQKELFLCNGCDENFKFYGFEGVIQHYAAKHTTALSMGSIIVYWRAEWPEIPPFNPDPSISKSAYYKIPTPTTFPGSYPGGEQQPLSSYGRVHSSVDVNSGLNSYNTSQPSLGTHTGASTEQPQNGPYSFSHHQIHPAAPVQAAQPSTFTHGPLQGVAAQHQEPIGTSPHNQGPTSHNHFVHYSNYGYPIASHPPTGAPAPPQSQFNIRHVTSHPPHFDPSRNNAAQFTELYREQMEEMAKHAREVWFGTSGIKDLPQSVRIYVVIHHMAARFATRFANVPSLAMFLDGLDNNAQMRPVRSLNGLACKTCVTQLKTTSGSFPQSQPPTGDRRLYTLPLLLNHFRTAHLEAPQAFASPNTGPDGPRYDWTQDMIELPEMQLITNLISASGMDDGKLELIAWAFPQAFPSPLPKLGAWRSSGPVPPSREASSRRKGHLQHGAYDTVSANSPATEDRVDQQPYARPFSGFGSSSQPSRASEPPGEDEYDPHKPAYMGKSVKSGPDEVAGSRGIRSPGVARRLYELPQSHGGSPMAETTDLSRLIYSATQVHPTYNKETPAARSYEQVKHYHQPAGQNGDMEDRNGRYEPYDRQIQSEEAASRFPLRLNAFDDVVDGQNSRPTQPPREDAMAAERFLRTLGQASTSEGAAQEGNSGHSERLATYGDDVRWSGESVGSSLKNQRGDPTPLESKSYDIPHEAPQASPGRHARTARLVPTNEQDAGQLQSRQAEGHFYDANYRGASSNARISVDEFGRTARPYIEYSTPGPKLIRDDQHVEERDYLEFPRSRGLSQVSQVGRYRNRSRSPPETPYYRPRTPADVIRQQTSYQIRSPLQLKESRSQRVLYQPHLQDRYAYVDDNVYPPDQYRQRIEYVPVRVGHQGASEPNRYVIAQPMADRERPEYVRLGGYDPEPVYERDGQLYRAETRKYPTQPDREIAGFRASYPY